MKWWFSSWNLFLFSLSKVCRISSADCFISGFTASQSPLFCGAKYSGLHFAWIVVFFLLFCNKVFLPLRRAILIVIFHFKFSITFIKRYLKYKHFKHLFSKTKREFDILKLSYTLHIWLYIYCFFRISINTLFRANASDVIAFKSKINSCAFCLLKYL